MIKQIIDKPHCVIVLDDNFKKLEYDCPICKFALRHYGDVISIKSFGCCEECQAAFYWPNIEKWKNGWRPKNEDVLNVFNNYNCLEGDSQNDK